MARSGLFKFPVAIFLLNLTLLWRLIVHPHQPTTRRNYERSIEDEPFVGTEEDKHASTLFIMAITGPHQQHRRNVMRDTWLDYGDVARRYGAITHKFMIGTRNLNSTVLQMLHEEQALYNDLALMDGVEEHWKNLTGKLIESMAWSVTHVGPYDYLMKVDDDTFVRLDLLMPELVDTPDADVDQLYWGYFDGRARIIKRGKYAEPAWNVCDHYLPYALGGGYVISASLVHYVASQRFRLSRHNAEDASLGLWLGALNITRKHDVRFDTEWASRGCLNHHIVLHKVSPDSMLKKHQILKRTQGEEHCEEEWRRRPEYEYVWDVLPTDCCPGRRNS
eukprot:m.322451 g.322451  ORF g.322451 m.322451 type:complete len:334 (+) comp20351_c1_seq6:205-1206(+)